MQFLASKFRSQPVAQPTGAELVDKYCDRATHATLIEDRRAAVLGLKGLAHEYKLVKYKLNRYNINMIVLTSNLIY